jgi:hypothetical protein
MESLIVEILNPKAKKLLENLADLNLISISNSKPSLDNLLNILRAGSAPSFDEITKEVENVRAKRNEEKTTNSYH